ncbi:hypothetical protein K1T71_014681 [Dendrolimus kikuchii]|uniref:Uncharacterized protein n=1 Tax=Dendrolimus kikuchii TaxID=765133 RepID=A0ACC1CEP2_9NEOP|nr:hypothetical protein K1T71_014681 [Dendrolimus kikuchii]
MAAPSNGSGNLVEEFEESFQACLNVLTKQDTSPSVEKEEVKVEVERFIDLARQMEAFFLQKRFLLSAMKPELLVKEDNAELRCELQRKEELLRRHYDKINQWQNLLADLQGHTVYNKCQQQSSQTSIQQTPPPQQSCSVQQSVQAQQMAAAAAAQQAAALHQQAALQQQQIQNSLAQSMFLGGGRGGYAAAPLQGPLAYLEKSATNIGRGASPEFGGSLTPP